MKNPIFKKYMNLVMIIGLILGFVVFAGCTDKPKITNQTPNVSVITQPSTIPTTYHYVKSIREIPGNDTNVTVQKTVQVAQTPVVKATLENVDIESMEFIKYNNNIVELTYPKEWNVTKSNNFISITNPSKIVFYNITIVDLYSNAWRVNDRTQWYYDEIQRRFPKYDPRRISGIDKQCSIDGITSCLKYTVTIPNKEVVVVYTTCSLHYGYQLEFSTSNTSVFNHYKNVGDYMTGMVKIKDIRTT